MLILAYEPDPLERELLKVILEHEGFSLEAHATEEPVARRASEMPQAFVLVNVDDLARGLALVTRVRAAGNAPVVAIGRRQDDDASARLFEAGADEVLARPLGPRLLVARIENLARRAISTIVSTESAERVQVGEFKLLPTLQQLHVGGHVVPLTPLQTRLLYYLMSNAGHTVPRSRLEDRLWGCDSDVYGRHIKTHICHLRRKLEAVAPGGRPPIETIKGSGYLFLKATA